jgi:hypothetical protein
MSTEIQALKMGGLELEKALNNMNKRVDYYGDLVITGLKATMTLTMEMDLKALARYMIVLLNAKVLNFVLGSLQWKNCSCWSQFR